MTNTRDTDTRLSFEYDELGGRLEIHGNRKGLEHLVEQLQFLIRTDRDDHIHLMTQEWGGSGLSSEKENARAFLVHHVKIFRLQ